MCNYWLAMAVEYIFSSHGNVNANKNKYDKLVDLTIEKIPFDHKTSVFFKGFSRFLSVLKVSKESLLSGCVKIRVNKGENT